MQGKVVVLLVLLALCFTDRFILKTNANETEDDADTVVDSLKAEKIPKVTDDHVAQREERSRSVDGLSDSDRKRLGAQQFAFNADVNRLMDIIIHSLYSNREIFIRELVSNASDALDKIRFRSLTNPELLDAKKEFEVRVKASLEDRSITISDTGIGMTRDDMINNLGTVAQSGTRAFSEALEKGAASNLIGQFGVGFYSAYLVADKITVTSKHPESDKQWIWESNSQDSYNIYEDPASSESPLGRGTSIKLYLKSGDDFDAFLEHETLHELLVKYSSFINFPIYLWTAHEEDRQVEAEPAEETDESEEEDESEETTDEEEEETKPEKAAKTVKETVWQWEHINLSKPIWMRSNRDVAESEYFEFYHAIAKTEDDPLTYVHFNAEGDTEFRSILFIPKKPPVGQFDPNVKSRSVKLYVRRVFITDDFDTVIPKYLAFINGVVDSNDIPLNVSREILQENKALQVIRKRLVRKAISMFQKLAEDETKYDEFFTAFGTNLKLGVIEDTQNRTRLSKLLRFMSSKTGKLTSFDDYVSRMKEGQEQIYYLAGLNENEVKRSPLAESLLKRGYEVLYMLDPIDEYVLQNLSKYDSKYKITNIGKEGLKFEDDEETEKEELKEKELELKDLSDFFKKEFPEQVNRVVMSNRLVGSPCAFVAETWGYTATMERVMQTQALADKRMNPNSVFLNKKVLELNHRHPLITKLHELVQTHDANAKEVAALMLNAATLTSGFDVKDTGTFAKNLQSMLRRSLGIAPESDSDYEPVNAKVPQYEDARTDNTEHDEL